MLAFCSLMWLPLLNIVQFRVFKICDNNLDLRCGLHLAPLWCWVHKNTSASRILNENFHPHFWFQVQLYSCAGDSVLQPVGWAHREGLTGRARCRHVRSLVALAIISVSVLLCRKLRKRTREAYVVQHSRCAQCAAYRHV